MEVQKRPQMPFTQAQTMTTAFGALTALNSWTLRILIRATNAGVEDLSPYVCVYGDCDSPLSMYVTTAEWKKHIKDKHSRARWICDPCWLSSDRPEEFEFDTEEEWHTHTLAEHEDEIDESDLPDLAELSQRTRVPPVACPLCHEDGSLRNPETDDHLAEHLHHFALQALPWESIRILITHRFDSKAIAIHSEPSSLSEMQLLGNTRALEASDKPRSDKARDPENRELGSRGGVRVDVLTLADQDQSRNNMTTFGEKLEHLKMQFHGQDGTGKERPHYIPRYSLEEFWETQSINTILRAHSVNKSQGVIRHSFLCTFSLLVYINEVRFLEWLIERNLKDASFPLEARPSFWPDTPATNRLFEAITESQWIFFPVTFDQHKLYNQVFGPHYIFPICKQDLIKAGDTVQFHKIETNPSYKGSDTATRVRKTYNESSKAQYEREVKTFSRFVEGGNLEEFYTAMSPPRSLPETNKIWNAFCGVLEGLHHLHSAAINTNFQTIHQDIKPDNLLVSKSASGQPYDIELVITDFGYSHTKTAKSSPETRGIGSHEGQVYGAPESNHLYPRGGQTDITPKIDIWSLGCVMSEAAIWIKSGRQGLEDYRNRRLAEARKLPIRHGVDYVACFHDSAEALSTVRMTHDWIRGSFPDDTITLQVLDMIETCIIEYSPPPSPVVESSGSQPNEAPHPQFFNHESLNTVSPVPWSVSRSPVSSGPILTFDQAREWYDHAKKNRSPVDPKVQDVVRQLGNNVRGRDHIFFVDVSESMGEHFREIAEKFKILAYLAKQFDPDGVEVCFSSEVPSIHQGTTSKLLRKFYHQEWDQFSFEDKIGTFIDRIVIPRLSSWHQRLGLTKPKNLTIFVLTDGRWGVGETGAAGVEKPIMKLIDVIRGKRLSRTQVAIQFLRFGDDPDGERYLAYLDQFGLQYNCDCIDTSPIDGNIFDMFIGAISPDIDSAGGM
ncbi:hypothetical protein CDV36_008220 [Fusarium kuroshium]|uniref:non-specific serine/threonine protein kinase n=1 Tax=Fusarium kuroshium TaxID=2010991 RepID=A0A3M2S3J7_9HYPO|nr:hypothetical protein CDV36_008220 [Fusarium kuroshium]